MTEDGGQRLEVRGQRTEVRGQKTEDGGQRLKDKGKSGRWNIEKHSAEHKGSTFARYPGINTFCIQNPEPLNDLNHLNDSNELNDHNDPNDLNDPNARRFARCSVRRAATSEP